MENLEMDDMEKITKVMFAILDMSTDVVGLLHNLNPEKFCEDHFKGFKEFKEGKEKMDLKA